MTLTARCSTHADTPTRPAECAVCARIAIERRIVRATVRALLKAGYLLNVDNGGDTEELAQPTADRHAILAELMNTDDDYLTVYKVHAPTVRCAWVRFIYGNDGWDVINDYTTSLDPILEPVLTLADELAS